LQFNKQKFYRNVGIIAFVAFFLTTCLVTGYVTYIKGKLNQMNERMERANHYEIKLQATVRRLQQTAQQSSPMKTIKESQTNSVQLAAAPSIITKSAMVIKKFEDYALPKESIDLAIEKLGEPPSLSEEQLEHVKRTWTIVQTLGTSATDLFYQTMFSSKPHFRGTLFANVDIRRQSKMLYAMLNQAVEWLEDAEKLTEALMLAGARHVYYGVKDFHYPLIGSDLIKTLRMGLGDNFTAQVEEAWLATYTVIQYWMRVGDLALRHDGGIDHELVVPSAQSHVPTS
jgi:hemoglobin-like flavoprotein